MLKRFFFHIAAQCYCYTEKQNVYHTFFFSQQLLYFFFANIMVAHLVDLLEEELAEGFWGMANPSLSLQDEKNHLLFNQKSKTIFQSNQNNWHFICKMYTYQSRLILFLGSNLLINPLMPSGSFNICCPRDAVSGTANVERTARH